MCECGCTSNWSRYRFPGPGKVFYLLSLSPACVNCDAPPGVSIERFKPGDFGYGYYRDDDHVDGDLNFEKWSDSEGVAVVCGKRQHEFVAALLSHIVGIGGEGFGDGDGTVDECDAEVILEEAYEDSLTAPALVDAKAMAEAQDAN